MPFSASQTMMDIMPLLASLFLLGAAIWNIASRSGSLPSFGWLCLAASLPLAQLSLPPKLADGVTGRILTAGAVWIPLAFIAFTRMYIRPARPLPLAVRAAGWTGSAIFSLLCLLVPDWMFRLNVREPAIGGWIWVSIATAVWLFAMGWWIHARRGEKSAFLRGQWNYLLGALAAGSLGWWIVFAVWHPKSLEVFAFLPAAGAAVISLVLRANSPNVQSRLGPRPSMRLIELFLLGLLTTAALLQSWKHSALQPPLDTVWLLTMLLLAVGWYLFLGRGWLDRFFLREERRGQELLVCFIEDIVRLKQPSKLLEGLVKNLASMMLKPRLWLVVKRVEKNKFELWSENGPQPMPTALADFLPRMERRYALIERQTVAMDPAFQDVRKPLLDALASLDAQAMVPLYEEKDLMGLILVAPESGPTLSVASSLRMLRTLRPVLTIALRNAYLYEHIRLLSKDLWESNENLNEKVLMRTHELETTLSELRKLNEEQKEFFNMASHTFRTPLTSIKIASALLWGACPEQTESRLYLILQNNIRRMEILLSDVIEITRMSRGKLALNYQKVDLHDLVEEARREAAWLHPDRPVIWRTHLDPEARALFADRQRVLEVLTHLISNAMKFSGTPGEVELTIRPATSDTLLACGLANTAGQPPAFLEVAVADNGEGVPDADKQDIFSGFRQSSSSSKRYQGNGLGLFIAKRIVESHGGVIRVTNRPSGGAEFSFILPL